VYFPPLGGAVLLSFIWLVGPGGWGHMGGQQNSSDWNKNSEIRLLVCSAELSTLGQQVGSKKHTTESKSKKEE